MVRTIPSDRFAAVVAAAARVFITHGYQRAQVQDVADELGLAKGTLYGYAQGKAALFAAAVRFADGHEPLPVPADLPVPAPADGEVAALVSDRLIREVADLRLARALTDPLPADAPPADLRAEFVGIVTDLYARLARHRIAIKLIDRCGPELPDLAEVWFGTGRRANVSGIEEYLARRQQAGTVSLPGPAPLVARTIVELCALWAVHCHFDPAPGPSGAVASVVVDDAAVASMIAEIVARATTPTLK
ncbi:AcrR family transcriptional regulator [Kribbella aluminosa]|uniref:AcrR family transcriptional regulator n=1 Tax=Kribbella aluminosa TaxID=416017 RepID=A0ABS4UNN6_9ACTN|nr:TetR/AcrR family transcriptional regulator [Kribbella aluminosa]MBP2353257.1 AcrR family transcriptional regulator [Kribbella aluminosa]MBP2353279.1 AcrR family transcriptional regulator [Kribbella aluminosa]